MKKKENVALKMFRQIEKLTILGRTSWEFGHFRNGQIPHFSSNKRHQRFGIKS